MKWRPEYAQLFFGMATFGSATPVSKIVTGAMPVFIASFLRVGIGALVLMPWGLRNRQAVAALTLKDWLLIGAISAFGMFGFTALMLYGMRLVPGVIGAIVMSTAPAITAAASMLFFGDRATWRKIAAIAMAVAGLLVLRLDLMGGSAAMMGYEDTVVLGALLILAAVCCETGYTLLGKKASETLDPVMVAFLAAALSLPFFLPFAIWQMTSFDWSAVGGEHWLAVAWYGAGTLALGSWLWYAGVSKAEGSVAAGFMSVMPVSALVLSYILLGESFRWLHLLGFAIVFCGVLLISWEHARMSAKSDTNGEAAG